MSSSEGKLTEDEIALYDRQIRLWGLAAQTNMRSAKVLLINIGSIGTEITKNIVLSGIGHFHIMDASKVSEEDLGSQFFLSCEDVGKYKIDAVRERIMDLNPRVELQFDIESVDSINEDFFKNFDLIIATELNREQMLKINQITRKFNIPLYLSGSNGLFSYIFVDLIEFKSEDEKLKSIKATETGYISTHREIVHVETRQDDEDPEKVFEKITTRNTYKHFGEMLLSPTLEKKLTKRQLKRVSNVLPMTLTLLSQNCSNLDEFKNETIKMCDRLTINPKSLSGDYLEQFYNQIGLEFSPVSAIIGGAIAQDVVNILGKRSSPLNNFIVFDGITLDMPIFEL
ncbi:hypothetical protein KAFR_0B00350 [Kazachstania africana CBS 2517]|uniref:THIF-type NAD/FAD binding fold domain-containing protein n=1 Tax=Kazachstania africana (strain ATCC 22294 / BCRC 22015 / CBS 2517 / CECT 1963 / NBRC 1671 / NRRL Y-8276) TaxID=1071382 RepID=H2APN5_KAZAF|nr:hypothetical protein KAFR_0B00350 [Kazachstania africana CBS 2517]CCF56335.1 hypothetical protein KAFR_0B00350 [Kazachstania africana CBS 2517]